MKLRPLGGKSGETQPEPARPAPAEEQGRDPLPIQVFQFILSAGWIAFQIYIVVRPLVPMVQRPLHVMFAVALVFLFRPLPLTGAARTVSRGVDLLLAAIPLFIGVYFLQNEQRLLTRIVFIDPVFPMDIVLTIVLVLLLLEATRRTVGYSLFFVVLAFLLYGWFGYLLPSWLNFDGISLNDYVELLFLGDSGIFGIPVETSLRFVFYFVLFGAIYSAVGGSRLLVELGLKMTRKQKGGAAKAAVIASSLMGTVSGSAVANVTTTGVFTIPFMIRSGYTRVMAGAVEAIASTGGQLMPPIMGIGAFVMAELLGVPYLRIALAAVLPALLFYLSLFFLIDFFARRRGVGVMTLDTETAQTRIWPLAHMFVPLAVVVFYIVRGFTPTMAALWGCAAALVMSFLRRATRLDLSRAARIVLATGRQASGVAIPIAAIGIIIGVAIQSNLALKFSSKLIQISGGTLIGSLFFIILGCIILGMGLPTVAAYIMGAVFFVPPLLKFGFIPLAAHFFVFYFSILAMVTPPVALASFTAAGLAEGNVTRTGVRAFVLSLVAFMIPFVFIFRPTLLWEGSLGPILERAAYSAVGVIAWAAAIAGFMGRRLSILPRLALGAGALAILLPTGRPATYGALALVVLVFVLVMVLPLLRRDRQAAGSRGGPQR